MSSAPIIIFDSGVGGLSVMPAVVAALPAASIAYVADFAGLPYGEKTEMEVATRVCAILGRVTERLAPRLIVIACNTASTIALAHVRSVLDVAVVGTVPAIKPAATQTRSGVIGLLGTAATIRQPYVDRLAAEFASDKLLIRHAAPHLVGAAEAKLRGEAPDQAVVDQAIAGLIAAHPHADDIDTIVLGCTHFPLLGDELTAAAVRAGLGADVQMVDGAGGIARRVASLTAGQAFSGEPRHRAITTGDSAQLERYRACFGRFGIDDIALL